MKCPNCGSETPAGKRFCGDCGVMIRPPPPPPPVQLSHCPNCGAENPEGRKFCGDCGNVISVPPSVQLIPPGGMGGRFFSDRLSVHRTARAALLMGFALVTMSVILFVLSNAVEDEAQRLIWERNYGEAYDALDLADVLNSVTWIILVAGIICIVGGAVAFMSSDA